MVGRERLQVNEILNYCANRPDNLLVIDPIFRDAGAIGDILRQAKALNQRLIILGADRTSHVEHLKNTIHYKHVVGIRERIFVEPTDGLATVSLLAQSRHTSSYQRVYAVLLRRWPS